MSCIKQIKKLLPLVCVLLLLQSCRWVSQVPERELIVCLTFDDNALGVYENALPVMRQHGMSGTMFVNSGWVGRPGRMSWAQLDSLKHKHGWEIGGHTLNHEFLSLLTEEEAEYTIAADFISLSSHGLEPRSFATTFGYCPVDYYGIIAEYYRNIRTCFNTSMSVPLDRTALGSFGALNDMTAMDLLSRVTQGGAAGENLVIFLFHDIRIDNQDYSSNIHPDVFAEFIELLHGTGLKVLPLDEAVEYFTEF